MRNLGTALRLIILVALLLVALKVGAPLPAQAQMSCNQYCKTVCLPNGDSCCWITSTTCGCC